ncbi:MAG: YraN family protein [Lentisphaeria bacterium]|nr:YraN family protein [Lentisphaeria bacterium]
MSRFGKWRAAHLRLGSAGEKAAARMFRNSGCDVLLRDYKVRKGEIDLIVRDGKNLVFAEVKTRRAKNKTQAQSFRPAQALRQKQKQRIYRAAFTYMQEIGKPEIPYRFDLIEVIFLRSRLYMMRHWRSHFGVRNMKRTEQRINLFR